MTLKILLWGERDTPLRAVQERENESSSTIGKQKKEVVSASLFRRPAQCTHPPPKKYVLSSRSPKLTSP